MFSFFKVTARVNINAKTAILIGLLVILVIPGQIVYADGDDDLGVSASSAVVESRIVVETSDGEETEIEVVAEEKLERRTTLELITVEADCPNIDVLTQERKTCAILFDLVLPQPISVFPLLHKQPGLLMIGVDPLSDEMLVLSGRSLKLSMKT